jgi:hypothetical protein
MRGHITAIGVLYIIFAGLAVLVGIGILVWAAAAGTVVAKADQHGTNEEVLVAGERGEEVRVGGGAVSVTTPEGEHVRLQSGLVKWFLGIAGAVGVAYIVFGAVGVICGIGVLGLKPWARILGIIIGIMSLPTFPIGTGIGIYALVILFNTETVSLFAGGTPPQAAPQVPPQSPPPPPPTEQQ